MHNHIVHQKNGTTDTVPKPQPEFSNITLRLPYEVSEALRTSSFLRRIPQVQIVTEALRAHLNLSVPERGQRTSAA